MTQAVNDGFNNQQSLPFLPRNDPLNRWGNVIGSYLMLPGLRGFWPGSGIGPSAEIATADALGDLVGGNHMTPTANPGQQYENLIPFRNYNGTTQYYQISDATSNNAYDILGNESYINNPGLSLGCWVRFDNTASAIEFTMAKAGGVGTFAYRLARNASGEAQFWVSVDGTNLVNVSSSPDVIAANTWTFMAATFEPSTEIKVWINDTSYSNTTSIPATIFNSASALTLGANSAGVLPMDGQMNMNWICVALISDSMIKALYQQTRILYGV